MNTESVGKVNDFARIVQIFPRKTVIGTAFIHHFTCHYLRNRLQQAVGLAALYRATVSRKNKKPLNVVTISHHIQGLFPFHPCTLQSLKHTLYHHLGADLTVGGLRYDE